MNPLSSYISAVVIRLCLFFTLLFFFFFFYFAAVNTLLVGNRLQFLISQISCYKLKAEH